MISNKSLMAMLIIGLSIFFVTSLGIFNRLSGDVSSILFNSLGYTNKWSRTYGPSWLVNMNSNIGSFGSKELVFIISTIFFSYLAVTNRKIDALKFAITVIISLMFIVLVKYINSEKETVTIKEIFTETLANFPSGHTFISTVLYPSIAYFLSKENSFPRLKRFYFISAVSIVLVVGMSRVMGGGHTVTEVIAGWSLGISWFALIKFILFRKSNNKNLLINS